LAPQLRHPAAAFEPATREPLARSALRVGAEDKLPLTESLKDTVARVVPYLAVTIAPRVRAGERLLIAAHGNSLRALIKYLDSLSDQAIIDVNVPTASRWSTSSTTSCDPLRNYYLGDADGRREAQHAVAAQGKAR
jgi:2,3-bisphosphoglycerate-dependent phosphoglycerate mutase